MNLLSRIYIINDLSDLSHVHIALVTVGYTFSLLVVQGIKCVINFFFQKKKEETYAYLTKILCLNLIESVI